MFAIEDTGIFTGFSLEQTRAHYQVIIIHIVCIRPRLPFNFQLSNVKQEAENGPGDKRSESTRNKVLDNTVNLYTHFTSTRNIIILLLL